MDLAKLKTQLKRHEGLRLRPYQDSLGYWTCGYGHLMTGVYSPTSIRDLREEGIGEHTAEKWLDDDIRQAIFVARERYLTPDVFDKLSPARQQVLVNMAFNLGTRLLRFEFLKDAILEQDWKLARVQMLHSAWARQVKNRALELANMMEDG